MQNRHNVSRHYDLSVGVLCFQWRLLLLAARAGDLAVDVDDVEIEVQIRPFQPQQFAPAQAGGELRAVQLEHSRAFRFLEGPVQGLQRKRFRFLLLLLG